MSPVSASASRAWTISGRPVWRAAAIWARKLSACSVARAVLVVEVEPGLADADDLGMARGLDQRGRACAAPRSSASCGWTPTEHQTSRGARRWRAPCRTGRAWCRWSACRPRRRCAARASTPVSIARRAREVEMAMAVDQHQLAARRFAGSTKRGNTPAAPAARVPGTSALSKLGERPARRRHGELVEQLPAESGMKGCTAMATRRMVSASTYSTVSHAAPDRSCAAPTAPGRRHSGWRRAITSQIASARDGRPARRARARTVASSALGAVEQGACRPRRSRPWLGTLPPALLAIIDSTRWPRLPKSLARSPFIRPTMARAARSRRRCRTAPRAAGSSAPDRARSVATSSTGSMTLPSDFEIFWPSMVHQPCAKTRCGGARPAAIRKAGQ